MQRLVVRKWDTYGGQGESFKVLHAEAWRRYSSAKGLPLNMIHFEFHVEPNP